MLVSEAMHFSCATTAVISNILWVAAGFSDVKILQQHLRYGEQHYEAGVFRLVAFIRIHIISNVKGTVHSELKFHPFTARRDVDGGSGDIFSEFHGGKAFHPNE